MKEVPVLLSPREQQIAELLLQGCDNAEIAKQLKMNQRTVKAHFNRLFVRFGIHDGIKRVKLATLLYRKRLRSEASRVGGTFAGGGSDGEREGRETLPGPCCPAAKTIAISRCSRWQLDGRGKDAALGKHRTLSTFPLPRRRSLEVNSTKVC